MADVSFNEEPTYAPPAAAAKPRSSFTDLIQKWGFAKDQKSAEIVLLSTAVILLLIAGVLIFMGAAPHKPVYAPPIPPPPAIPAQ